jgi:hypothetical protein
MSVNIVAFTKFRKAQGADPGTKTRTTACEVHTVEDLYVGSDTALACLLANIVASQNLGKRKVQTKAPKLQAVRRKVMCAAHRWRFAGGF